MTRKRILLAGAGRWGKILIRNLHQHPGLQLAGLVTRQNEAELAFTESGTEFFTEFEDALSKGWDGVILTTPPSIHGGQLLSCMEAGIPTLVEKPLTLSVREAELLAATAARFKSSVLVDHTQLFQPAYEWLKHEFANPNQILNIESEAGNMGPYRSGYSALWDYGAHDVSMILDLLGQFPAEIQATASDVKKNGDAEAGDYSATLVFASGVQAHFAVSNQRKEKLRNFRVETADSFYLCEDVPVTKLTRIKKRSGDRTPIDISSHKPVERLLNVFADGLEGKIDARWGLNLGVDVIRCLEAFEKSIKTQA